MADPISYAVGTAVLSATGSFAIASATATAAFWAVTAAPFVLSAVLAEQRASQYRDALSQLNDDRGLQIAVPEAAPEALTILGYGTLAGRPIFQKAGEGRRPFLYIGREFAWHECDGLDSILINGTRILVDPVTGEATSTPFSDGSTSYARFSFRNGSLDQALDPLVAEVFPEIEATYRHRGHCTLFGEFHYGDGADRDAQEDKHRFLYGDGQFQPLFRIRGAKVYDPNRIGHSLSDPTTWEWTENRSLNLAWWLNRKFPGFYDRINWEFWAEAARYDDEYVFTKAGEAIRRNTASGVIADSQPAEEVIAGLLSAGGGKLIRAASRYYVVPARKRAPVGTLHKANLRGGLRYNRDKPVGELVNEIRPEFFSTERGYKIVPAPIIRVDADVTADGMERPRSIRLPFTERHERAQRNAQRIYNEERVRETAQAGCDITALKWRAGDVITLDLGDLYTGRLTGQWEILKKAFDAEMRGYVLDLRKYDSTVYDFDPPTEEQDFSVEEDPVT